jgi:hypothetical protein
MTPMSFVERLAFAWSTIIAAALAYIYGLSYVNPNRTRMTRLVTNWSYRRYGRWSLEGPKQMLVLGILFSLMAIAGAVLTLLGEKP